MINYKKMISSTIMRSINNTTMRMEILTIMMINSMDISKMITKTITTRDNMIKTIKASTMTNGQTMINKTNTITTTRITNNTTTSNMIKINSSNNEM